MELKSYEIKIPFNCVKEIRYTEVKEDNEERPKGEIHFTEKDNCIADQVLIVDLLLFNIGLDYDTKTETGYILIRA